MSVFGEQYAGMYDALAGERQPAAESAAVVQLVNDLCDGKAETLLDIGCGTGDHAKILSKNFKVTGLDISPAMLKLAAQKCEDAEFLVGNCRDFDLGKQFDVVIMMSAVLGYQRSNDDVLATLRQVRKHLRPGGLFVFDTWYGPAVLATKPSKRLKEINTSSGTIIRMVEPNLVPEQNLCVCHYKWWCQSSENGEEHHTLRYFFPMEMYLFLENAGLKLTRFGKAGHAYRPITNDDWHVLFAARG